MALHVLDHPLGSHILTRLRDKTTPPEQFRQLSATLTILLAVEASRQFSVREKQIQTPICAADGHVLEKPIAAVPILRAGLGMLHAVLQAFPKVSVGYIGLERDEATALASSYYCKLPDLKNHETLLLDPMLATGGSACRAVKFLKEGGAESITMTCIVAAPEGVEKLQTSWPDVEIYTAALDERLNEAKYIVPGLGDFGDRLYGTGQSCEIL